MPHPLLILYVTLAVFMIMIGVIGSLYYVDVALSATTMIHLIIYDNLVLRRFCCIYLPGNGETRQIRVRQAIDTTGTPVFHGFVSSYVGIVVPVMVLVLVFGIAHALLLL